MLNAFSPRLDILPAPQQRLWPELVQTPDEFTLYGGTAIALHLGHRQSLDFDFFARTSFEPRSLMQRLPYLREAVVRQSAANNLTVTVDRGGPVQLSFFGALQIGQAAPEELAEGPRIKVAALIDLAGMKAAVVTQRAEARDYLDIHALLSKANISLSEMLAAGAIIYGTEFNPLLSLKAISYHDDLALGDLPEDVRHDLIKAVQATDPGKLPVLNAIRTREATP
ncbi:MAG: nucleotidyl transferase AbiEii/AbiGii toxin family protein [Xanthobacteraceae bacterium]